MILIKPDKNRRIDIPGVADPVARPVDVDQARTGFKNLRTLRIYQFETGSVIEGHAEEDEVFIAILSGSVELTMFDDTASLKPAGPVTLSAPNEGKAVACAAYLPPRASYKLVAKIEADVAYARATPSGTRPSRVFVSSVTVIVPGVSIVFEEMDHAERLRLQVLEIQAAQKDAAFMPIPEFHASRETVIHLRTVPAVGVATMSKFGAKPILLDSWDTVAVLPGDRPTLHIATGSSALALIIAAD